MKQKRWITLSFQIALLLVIVGALPLAQSAEENLVIHLETSADEVMAKEPVHVKVYGSIDDIRVLFLPIQLTIVFPNGIQQPVPLHPDAEGYLLGKIRSPQQGNHTLKAEIVFQGDPVMTTTNIEVKKPLPKFDLRIDAQNRTFHINEDIPITVSGSIDGVPVLSMSIFLEVMGNDNQITPIPLVPDTAGYSAGIFTPSEPGNYILSASTMFENQEIKAHRMIFVEEYADPFSIIVKSPENMTLRGSVEGTLSKGGNITLIHEELRHHTQTTFCTIVCGDCHFSCALPDNNPFILSIQTEVKGGIFEQKQLVFPKNTIAIEGHSKSRIDFNEYYRVTASFPESIDPNTISFALLDKNFLPVSMKNLTSVFENNKVDLSFLVERFGKYHFLLWYDHKDSYASYYMPFTVSKKDNVIVPEKIDISWDNTNGEWWNVYRLPKMKTEENTYLIDIDTLNQFDKESIALIQQGKHTPLLYDVLSHEIIISKALLSQEALLESQHSSKEEHIPQVSTSISRERILSEDAILIKTENPLNSLLRTHLTLNQANNDININNITKFEILGNELVFSQKKEGTKEKDFVLYHYDDVVLFPVHHPLLWEQISNLSLNGQFIGFLEPLPVVLVNKKANVSFDFSLDFKNISSIEWTAFLYKNNNLMERQHNQGTSEKPSFIFTPEEPGEYATKIIGMDSSNNRVLKTALFLVEKNIPAITLDGTKHTSFSQDYFGVIDHLVNAKRFEKNITFDINTNAPSGIHAVILDNKGIVLKDHSRDGIPDFSTSTNTSFSLFITSNKTGNFNITTTITAQENSSLNASVVDHITIYPADDSPNYYDLAVENIFHHKENLTITIANNDVISRKATIVVNLFDTEKKEITQRKITTNIEGKSEKNVLFKNNSIHPQKSYLVDALIEHIDGTPLQDRDQENNIRTLVISNPLLKNNGIPISYFTKDARLSYHLKTQFMIPATVDLESFLFGYGKVEGSVISWEKPPFRISSVKQTTRTIFVDRTPIQEEMLIIDALVLLESLLDHQQGTLYFLFDEGPPLSDFEIKRMLEQEAKKSWNPDMITDNQDAVKKGRWIPDTSLPGYYGNNFLSDLNLGKGSMLVSYPLSIIDDFYEIYVHYPSSPSLATNTKIKIYTAKGIEELTLNQQQNGGSWHYLGFYHLDKESSIELSNEQTNGIVVADAIKVTQVSGFGKVISDKDAPTMNITPSKESSSLQSIEERESLRDNQTSIENRTTSINDSLLPLDETPLQLPAKVGEPVRWLKRIKAENNQHHLSSLNVSTILPIEASDLSIREIHNKTILGEKIALQEEIQEKKKKKILGIFAFGKQEAPTEKKAIFGAALETNETKEYLVSYETKAPTKTEKNVSKGRKEIIIGSSLHYTNILASTELMQETPLEGIQLYWLQNGSKVRMNNITFIDNNNNSLIDAIAWVVPHLSNQTFEVEILVLNVQSYPSVGGNWTVNFNTTGTANLTIRVINGTTWSDERAYGDLKFLSLFCGATQQDYVWVTEQEETFLFVENYSCNNYTSYETSRVYTPGEHYLEFDFGGIKAYANNYASGWLPKLGSKRKEITITNPGTETLIDFPAYLNVSYDSNMQSDYDDLRFVNGSCNISYGNNGLSYELEDYDSASAHIWIKIPLIESGNTSICMYYDDPTALSGEQKDYVWNDEYKAVWHLAETGTGTRYDSSVFGNNGTPAGYDNDEAIDGVIGGADELDGTDDSIDIINGESMKVTSFTFSAWIKMPDVTDQNNILFWGADTSLPWGGYGVSINRVALGSAVGDAAFWVSANMVGSYDFVEVAHGMDTNDQWYHIAGTWNDSQNKATFFVDGDYAGETVSAFNVVHANIEAMIGNYSSYRFEGAIDEMRISNGTRSTDWLNLSYKLMANQTEYVSFDTEESTVLTDWWNANFLYRKRINISNNVGQALNADYAVNITLDTTGDDFLDDGSDTRIVYWNGSAFKELQRDLLFPNTSTSDIWFYLNASIADGSYDDNYWVYYGNENVQPPSAANIVINFSDYTVDTYDGGQGCAGGRAIEDGGYTLRQWGNCWSKVARTTVIGADTAFDFDFDTDGNEAEIHGIGVDTDNSISSGLHYAVWGSQNWADNTYRTYDSYTPDPHRYIIEPSWSSTYTYLTFSDDDDSAPRDSNNTFSYLKVREYYGADPDITVEGEEEYNEPPFDPVVSLQSSDGSNSSKVDLECTANLIDAEANLMNVTVLWYNGDVLNLTVSYNNNYANNTAFTADLSSSYITLGDTWICSMQITDGDKSSSWINSSSLSIVDLVPPNWFTPSSYPSSPATYAPNQQYQFNTTWTDNEELSNITIEHNFTGTLTNYSVDNSSSEFYYNYSDLPVGDYIWKYYANDTSNNRNETAQSTYTVSKANPDLNLSADPHWIAFNGTNHNVTCQAETNQSSISLWRDGEFIMEGTGIIVYENASFDSGLYNYTCNASATQNYTSAEENNSLKITTKYLSNCSLTFNPASGSSHPVSFNASCICDNNSETDPQLWRDGIDVTAYNNIFTSLWAGTHNYTCNISETASYEYDIVEKEYSIVKNSTTCTLSFDPASPSDYETQLNASCGCTNTETSPSMFRNGTDITAEIDQYVVLPASHYEYVCNITSTQNYTIGSDSGTYIVTRKSGFINLSLEGNNANLSAERTQQINISAVLDIPTTGYLELYNNGVLFQEGNSPLENISYWNNEGTYNITAMYGGNENYTATYSTYFIIVNDTIGPSFTIYSPSGTIDDPTPTINVSLNETVSELWYSWNNGITNTTICTSCSGNQTLYSLIPEGSYTLRVYANDSYGNTNEETSAIVLDMNRQYYDTFDDNSSVLEIYTVAWDYGNFTLENTSGLTDDFSTDTSSLHTQIDEGSSQAPGVWAVTGGLLRQSANINTFDSPKWSGTFFYRNDFVWTHYNFSVTSRSTDDDQFGIMFHYQDADNYYRVHWGRQRTISGANYLVLDKRVSGVTSALDGTATQYTQNQWYDFDIIVNDTGIYAYIDGTLTLTGTKDSNLEDGGTIAYYSWGNQNSEFDDVTVVPIAYGNFTSHHINTSNNISSISNVTWVEDSSTDIIAVEISVDDGLTWYPVTRNQGVSGFTKNNSLKYRVFFESNSTDFSSLSTINITWDEPPTVSIALIEPTSNLTVSVNDTFTLSVNVTCLSAYCGEVNTTLESDNGTKYTATNVTGTEPFWTEQWNPNSTTLAKDESITITYTVNATGPINASYYMYAYANITSDMTTGDITEVFNVTIISEYTIDLKVYNISLPLNNTCTYGSFTLINYSLEGDSSFDTSDAVLEIYMNDSLLLQNSSVNLTAGEIMNLSTIAYIPNESTFNLSVQIYHVSDSDTSNNNITHIYSKYYEDYEFTYNMTENENNVYNVTYNLYNNKACTDQKRIYTFVPEYFTSSDYSVAPTTQSTTGEFAGNALYFDINVTGLNNTNISYLITGYSDYKLSKGFLAGLR